MRYHWLIWSAVAAYLVVLVTVVLWRLRVRRRIRDLEWPPSITQQQMERSGSDFMYRLGWSVKLTTSHGTRSVYQCIKHHDQLYTVFLRDTSYYSRLLNSLRRENSWVLSRSVVVLYEPPTETMIASAGEVRLSLMHYLDLPRIEELHQGVLPRVMAAQAAEIIAKDQAAAARAPRSRKPAPVPPP